MTQATDQITGMRCWTTLEPRQGSGILYVRGQLDATQSRLVRCVLMRDGNVISEERFSPADFAEGVSLRDLQVRYWWPNLSGDQPAYEFSAELLDAAGAVLDRCTRPVGFKHVVWQPEEGTPWLCVVNDRPVFLQGVRWAPGGNLTGLRDLGVNLVLVEAVESDEFYAACDALGMLVWQVLPDDGALAVVARLQRHVSVLMWGGAEALAESVSRLDPTRRFLPVAPLVGAPVDLAGWTQFWAYDERPFPVGVAFAGEDAAQALAIAVSAVKGRFPRSGGIVLAGLPGDVSALKGIWRG